MQNQTGETLDYLTSHLSKIANRTQNALETASNGLNNEIQTGINVVITNWLNQHPIIAWILEHPLLTLILIIFSLILALGAIKAVFQLIEKLGGKLINFPLMVVGFLLNRGKKPINKSTLDSGFNASLSTENLAQIVQKLEAIEKTQDKILQQLAVLQKSRNKLST